MQDTLVMESSYMSGPSVGFMKDLFSIEGLNVTEDVPLAGLTTFKIGGPARIFLEPCSLSALVSVLSLLHRAKVKYYLLGAGSNILVQDEGVACVLSLRGLQEFYVHDKLPDKPGVVIHAGAGISLKYLVSWSVRNGLHGLEHLIGIPASLGGAVIMNAGTKEGMVSDCMRRLLVADRHGLSWMDMASLSPGYRAMNIGSGQVVCAVELELLRADKLQVRSNALNIMARRRTSQPIGLASAGCIFKNPPDNYAGKLIESCGLKGYRSGNAMISDVHANFIVNLGGATYWDVMKLITLAKDRVMREFAVDLSLEVELWHDMPDLV